MGKKGKGRQSGGFGSKSLKANHHQEVSQLKHETLKWTRRETAGFVAWTNAHQKHQRRLAGERPRFVSALRRNLNGILSERQALRAHDFRERRRRNGFLPTDDTSSRVQGFDDEHQTNVSKGLSHPPGWWCLQRRNNPTTVVENRSCWNEPPPGTEGRVGANKVSKLQDLALTVFAHYIREYRSAMGDEELYGALSILPPESITEISVLLSSGTPTEPRTTGNTDRRRGRRNRREAIDVPPALFMDDDLAMLLGQHQHVERLCFRSTRSSERAHSTLTNSGLEALIPRTPMLGRNRARDVGDKQHGGGDSEDEDSSGTDGIPECWDDDDDTDSSVDEDFFGSNDEECLKQRLGFTGDKGGCNLRLRRLELLDLSCSENTIDVDDNGNTSTTSILLRWFERCSGITHLSLAGSFPVHHEVGRAVLLSLSELLPALEVLDVTRCPWATDNLLARTMGGYYKNYVENNSRASQGDQSNGVDNRSPPSSLRDLLPTIYYYRGTFEWLSEITHSSFEPDLWDDLNGV